MNTHIHTIALSAGLLFSQTLVMLLDRTFYQNTGLQKQCKQNPKDPDELCDTVTGLQVCVKKDRRRQWYVFGLISPLLCQCVYMTGLVIIVSCS